MAHYEVRDNFLTEEFHAQLNEFFQSTSCPWLYQPCVHLYGEPAANEFEHYFVCPIYESGVPLNMGLHESLRPLYDALEVKALVRVRALLYPNQTVQYAHGKHVDAPYPVKACVYYINTNDGYTELEDGTRIESIANRALLFDGNSPHNSATCTDQKIRSVLNINYF